MEDSWSPLVKDSELRAEFLQGLEYVRIRDWKSARVSFCLAERCLAEQHHQRNLYASYHGFVLVMNSDLTGLGLCRKAALEELFYADVFANLARVELRLKKRRRAFDAVTRGLRIDPGHVGLRNIRSHMGVRREPVVAFLDRNHPLNQFLGRLTY